MNKIKQLPYGVSDFEYVMRENFYYVDKTMYIPQLEAQPNNLMFIRPRRFGKSLLLSMLKTYYDKAKKDQFEEIFGSLWIGKHPTPLMGRYQVMHLDFSQIGGSIDELEKKFDEYLCFTLDDFVNKYANDYPDYFIKAFFESSSGSAKLIMITSTANRFRIPIYVFIDEFDDKTSLLLDETITEYDITYFERVFVDFFNKIKGNVERLFITGISPILFYNQGGGFNFGWNISSICNFDNMLGFTTEEIREMLAYYKVADHLPVNCDIEALIEEIRPWFGSYCFANNNLTNPNRVFNSHMVIDYLNRYIKYGQSPEVMLDTNTKTDFSKLRNLIQLDSLDGNRKGILRKIVEEGEIVAEVLPSFHVYQLLRPRMFVSLLFYYGLLTIKGTCGPQLILGIPNNNVRMQCCNYLNHINTQNEFTH